jgi:hypothetical protein
MKDLALKVFSLLVAILLAYFVISDRNASLLSVMLPVEIKNVPDDMVVVAPSVKQAQLTLRGPTFDLNRLATNPPLLSLNLPKGVQKRYLANLREISLPLPAYVRVVRIEPAQLEIELDKVSRRELPVELRRIGELKPELKLQSIEISPKQVLVKGPQAEVESLKHIDTEPLDLSLITESTSLDLDLVTTSPYAELADKSVKVSINVEMPSAKRHFKGLEIEIRTHAGNFVVLNPSLADIEVRGAPDLIQNLKAGDIVPFVRPETLAGGAPGNMHVANVQVDLPRNVSLVSVVPEQLEVYQGEDAKAYQRQRRKK